jgi:hypothetical protein
MKARIHFVSMVKGIGDGMGDIFLAFFGLLSTKKHLLIATAYLSIVADRVDAFMTTVYHLLMATSNRITHHVPKLK